MLSEKNLTANVFDNLTGIQGETVKGVLSIPNTNQGKQTHNWLIIFESGYSLEVHYPNMSFWINKPEKTQELLQEEFERRESLLENLDAVKSLLK